MLVPLLGNVTSMRPNASGSGSRSDNASTSASSQLNADIPSSSAGDSNRSVGGGSLYSPSSFLNPNATPFPAFSGLSNRSQPNSSSSTPASNNSNSALNRQRDDDGNIDYEFD